MKMANKYLIAVSIATAALFSSAASAAAISCNVNNAKANGDVADQCAGTDTNPGNPEAERAFVNNAWPSAPGEEPFMFVDKTGESSAVSGFVLSVSTTDYQGLAYSYTLAVPLAWQGLTVDWVLGVKQDQRFIAYLFENVTLGVDGGFNSFNVNGGFDYSHASGFIRETEPEGFVPLPGTVLLLGLGLAGIGLVKRRKA